MVDDGFCISDKIHIARLVYKKTWEELQAGEDRHYDMWAKAPPGTAETERAGREYERWKEAVAVKFRLDEMGPYRFEFPSPISPLSDDMCTIRKKLGVVYGNVPGLPLRGECGLRNPGEGLISLRGVLEFRMTYEAARTGEVSQMGLENSFFTFLREGLPEAAKLQPRYRVGYVVEEDCFPGTYCLVVNEGGKCLIQIKDDEEPCLETAICQAALYAVYMVMAARERVCRMNIAAVTLPSMIVILGMIETTLDDKYHIESSRLIIAPQFVCTSEEDSERLLEHLVAPPESTISLFDLLRSGERV
eukprot:GHVO01034632.1.p1 GENE.GHVO01034632.1~~GHVO01034632.1.p1  ORF type:complete len:304 (+),score=34.97 GHVO01034632.1:97-1008(+)